MHQRRSTKELIESLHSDEAAFLIDFSENYSCKYTTEVQAVEPVESR